jgi:hypothetical protein
MQHIERTQASVGTRRTYIMPATANPNEAWVREQTKPGCQALVRVAGTQDGDAAERR